MNYEESLSTLRYADNAKKIQNKAVINESATDKIIRELKSENDKLKEMLRKAASGNGTINLADLGLGDVEDIIENMDHAQQELEDMEGDFEKKLEQEKVNNVEKEKELQEKQKKENKREPHLVNLNEDPQLSQHIYYGFKEEMPVKVGRKTDFPLPKIIFGGVSVTSNHGQFVMLDSGLIQFEMTGSSACEQTLINGKKLPSEHKQILKHLDTIFFGSGAMLLFKYPLMKVKVEQITAEIKAETAGDDQEEDLAEDEINILVMSRLMDHGLFDPEDEEKITECLTYTDEDIQADMQAIDWEGAYIEVERMEEKKRAAQLEAILKQERLKAEQQYELR